MTSKRGIYDVQYNVANLSTENIVSTLYVCFINVSLKSYLY